MLPNENNTAVMILTETWLDESIENGEIYIKGYSLYRSDRIGRNRGGVCIYIKSDIPVKPIMKFSNGVVETVMIKIPIWDLILCGVYRPQDTKIN